MLTRCSVLNPYHITQPPLQSIPSTKRTSLSIGVIAGIAVGGAFVLFSILAGVFFWRRHSKLKDLKKPTKEISQKPTKKRAAPKASEDENRNNRKHSNGSGKRSKESTSTSSTGGSRNHSNRSTGTKTSQRSSRQQIESEKARAEVEVRRVVSQQLDAFRRSGYYDAPTPRLSRAIAVPVIPAMPPVELEAIVPYELFGGEELFLPVIEEEEPKELATESSEERIEGLLIASGEEGAKEPTTPSSEVFKQPSRASSRAMILDRR